MLNQRIKYIVISCLTLFLNSLHSIAQTCYGTNVEFITVTQTNLKCYGSNDGVIRISNIGSSPNYNQYTIIEVKTLAGDSIFYYGMAGSPGSSFINVPNLRPGIYHLRAETYEYNFINGQFSLGVLLCGKYADPNILSPACDVQFTNLSFNTNPCSPQFGIASTKVTGTFCSPGTYRIINGVRDVTQYAFNVQSNFPPDTTYTQNQLNGLKPGDTIKFLLVNGMYSHFPGWTVEQNTCNYYSQNYFMPCDLGLDSIKLTFNTTTTTTLTGKASSNYFCVYGSGYNFTFDVNDTLNAGITGGLIAANGTFSVNVPANYPKVKLVWKMGLRCMIEKIINMPNQWTGSVSNVWSVPGNWSHGTVPGINTDVQIFSNNVIINSSVSIRSLRLGPGVQLNITSGNVLTILH